VSDSQTNALVTHLLALEEQRCQAIVDQRYDQLAELLSDRLIHTHTRGNVDDKPGLLAFLGGVIESVALRREGLRVELLGDTVAVMHGKQVNRARRRGTSDELQVEATVTQTWAREADDHWRVVAFHASPLGSPPPPVR